MTAGDTSTPDLQDLRNRIRAHHLRDQDLVVQDLVRAAGLDADRRAAITEQATRLITRIRDRSDPGLLDVFLAEYGLSTDEGVALMCLAEALLRVPDAETIDALIEDKIAPSEWGKHLGQSSSSLVNASTWALMLTGRVLNDDAPGIAGVLRGALRRLGEPVIRTAVGRAMKELGAQFVLGQTIDEAVARGQPNVDRGFTYSYDMLGEAALTQADADGYFAAYADAITTLARRCTDASVRRNPGISIKLSALHPRYEPAQQARVMAELVPRVLHLAQAAATAGMGLNIDAEEANRLDLSLDVIAAVLAHPSLAGWDGFGVVVQAYGRRAGPVLDWLYALATNLDRRIMVRLVKGAYWDTEIKRAQVEGLRGFPVFTQKAASDIAFIAHAKTLLDRTNRIYPQFATHNAQTVAAVLELARHSDPQRFEFQRLHGMGEALHDLTHDRHGTGCRIYAPVGAHRDLLAYLVRRLLENGANSSFVNQIIDTDVPAADVAQDPFERFVPGTRAPAVRHPSALFGAARPNARGWDLHDPIDRAALDQARTPFSTHRWSAGPILAGATLGAGAHPVFNPARPAEQVGHVAFAAAADVDTALSAATPWQVPAAQRRAVLFRAAEMFEDSSGELFALLAREAGKTAADAIAELREAVDFLRYYAVQADAQTDPARGLIACISPWNFPLAIFTGQVAAALAAGNGVVAKPAERSSIIAARAVQLLLAAGVPAPALQLLPGTGGDVGAALSADPRIDGLCFTGSTTTAQRINRAMAATVDPAAPLIAETGGINAMIVDSTALPEQAVRDILASAFQSAGQRCSALRCLYVQADVAPAFFEMLVGALQQMQIGDPWELSTDIGPVIDMAAQRDIATYIRAARDAGRVLGERTAPADGCFVAPTVIGVSGIGDIPREVFGPVLHVATFEAAELDAVVAAVNDAGYGLTFGMHSRIDDRVQQVTTQLKVGNIYVNRNQIGAIVGSQPFGGEGLSGTGPKAGGPAYVKRFTRPRSVRGTPAPEDPLAPRAPPAPLARDHVQGWLDSLPRFDPALLRTEFLPGPTGESNTLRTFGRGTVLCLGPTAEQAAHQAALATAQGCRAVQIAPGATGPLALDGVLAAADLGTLAGFDLVAYWATGPDLRAARIALAKRPGPLIALAADLDLGDRCVLERHTCIDTTAAGGNTALLASPDAG